MTDSIILLFGFASAMAGALAQSVANMPWSMSATILEQAALMLYPIDAMVLLHLVRL